MAAGSMRSAPPVVTSDTAGQHGQRRRQELIRLSVKLFAKKGYQAASLQDIADASAS